MSSRLAALAALVLLGAGCLNAGSPESRQSGASAADSSTTPVESGPSPSSTPDPSASDRPSTTSPAPTPPVSTTGLPGPPQPSWFVPHVLVGISDTGINPYHPIFYRPNLTQHPCTYIQGMPCSLKPLNLTLGEPNWTLAYEKDKAVWDSLPVAANDTDGWYWIPGTNIVAAHCEEIYLEREDRLLPTSTFPPTCILDDSDSHGTGTASSALMENPDALLAISEGRNGHYPFQAMGIPVDVYSNSWGLIAPVPAPSVVGRAEFPPVWVQAGGNDPRPSVADWEMGAPGVIVVSGGYASPSRDQSDSGRMDDVASYYCRTVAGGSSFATENNATHTAYWNTCGTSYSAPTVAGALSKVILALREQSGYVGAVSLEWVDPILRVSVRDLRDAMNRTASYDPVSQYPNANGPFFPGVPLNPVAPWLQWGWGFYDGWVANATIDYLLHQRDVAEKPDAAVRYMETVYAARQALYG